MTFRAAILPSLALLLTVAAPSGALADEYKINTIYYHNLGAYEARPMLRWNMPDGRNCEVRISKKLAVYDSGEINLNKPENFGFPQATDKAPCLPGGSIPDGMEIWAKIEITAGENKSCRKDNPVFRYYADGGRVDYVSRGSTTKNNACRVDDLPSSADLISSGGGASAPSEHLVKTLSYTNSGGYSAEPKVRWNRNGSNCEADPWDGRRVLAGATVTANLDNSKNWKRTQGGDANCSLPITKGEEVWIRVAIEAGETKPCRYDDRRMVYDPSGGKTAYKTAGTTTVSNACRIVSQPAAQ